MLEPYEGKLSSTVLREEGSRKAPDLPGAIDDEKYNRQTLRCDRDRHSHVSGLQCPLAEARRVRLLECQADDGRWAARRRPSDPSGRHR